MSYPPTRNVDPLPLALSLVRRRPARRRLLAAVMAAAALAIGLTAVTPEVAHADEARLLFSGPVLPVALGGHMGLDALGPANAKLCLPADTTGCPAGYTSAIAWNAAGQFPLSGLPLPAGTTTAHLELYPHQRYGDWESNDPWTDPVGGAHVWIRGLQPGEQRDVGGIPAAASGRWSGGPDLRRRGLVVAAHRRADQDQRLPDHRAPPDLGGDRRRRLRRVVQPGQPVDAGMGVARPVRRLRHRRGDWYVDPGLLHHRRRAGTHPRPRRRRASASTPASTSAAGRRRRSERSTPSHRPASSTPATAPGGRPDRCGPGDGRSASPSANVRAAEATNHEVRVVGRGGVPATGVSAVLLNVTAVAPDRARLPDRLPEAGPRCPQPQQPRRALGRPVELPAGLPQLVEPQLPHRPGGAQPRPGACGRGRQGAAEELRRQRGRGGRRRRLVRQRRRHWRRLRRGRPGPAARHPRRHRGASAGGSPRATAATWPSPGAATCLPARPRSPSTSLR